MSVRQLVDRIADMGLVEDRVLQKIRREIDDPEKNVKPKAILNFLVKKDQITKAQAAKLLKELEVEDDNGDDEPVPLDEIVVNLPEEKSYDTDDLTNLNPAEEVEVVDVSPQATRQDLAEVEEIVLPEPTPRAAPKTPAPPAYQADPLADPALMGDPLAGSAFDDPGSMSGPQPVKTLSGFSGKRNNRDQWATKWLYIGFGTLGFLLIIGAVLYMAVGGQNIEKLQTVAEDSFVKGAYMDAMAKYEKLLEMSPRHENASSWKVRIVTCLLAQPYEADNFSEVLKVAEEHLPRVCDEDKFGDLRPDLGIFLPRSALEVTDVANNVNIGKGEEGVSREILQDELAKAERAQSIVLDSRYLTGSIRKANAETLDKIADNVRLISDAIKKEDDYVAAQARIKELTAESRTDDAFKIYNLLVREHSDLATREELRMLMKEVSVKEVELVKDGEVNINGKDDDFPSLVESQVVVARREGATIDSLKGEVLPVLADGVLYGVDVGDGTILWNRFMGFESSYEPQWADPENHDELIVSDQRRNQVLKIRARDGSLVWRAEIGDAFCKPTVTVDRIFVSTFDGKMIGLDSATGNSFASAQLPQKVMVPPTASNRYPWIYQPGNYSNIYVLNQEDLTCKEVVYLGYEPGSVSAPIFEWSGYLLVPVNTADYCTLQVLKPSNADDVESGLGLLSTQLILRLTTGHISTPLFRMGRRVLAVSDIGDMTLLEMNKVENENSPVNVVSGQKLDARRGDRSFIQAQGSRLWIAGKGVERFRLSAVNEFKRKTLANPNDFFLAPVERFDDTMVHVRRRANSAMTSISAVNDDDSMSEIWRTDLGAAFAGAPRLVDGQVQVVSSQGDMFRVDEAAQRVGYIDRGEWSADVAENFQFDNAVNLKNGSYVCVGSGDRKEMLVVKADGSTNLVRLRMDAACPIVGFGDSLLVASSDRGQVGVISPLTGRLVGNPFQPPKLAGKATLWKKPAVLSDVKVAVGREDGVVFLLSSDGKDLTLVDEFKFEGKLTSGLVSHSDTAYGVVSKDDGVSLMAWSTDGKLVETASVQLDANLVSGPWIAGDSILFTDEQGEIVSYPLDLSQRNWGMSLNNDSLAGAPIVSGQSVLLTLASGVMKVVDMKSGEVKKEVDLGQPVKHEPIFTTEKVFIGGADGRLLVLPTSAF